MSWVRHQRQLCRECLCCCPAHGGPSAALLPRTRCPRGGHRLDRCGWSSHVLPNGRHDTVPAAARFPQVMTLPPIGTKTTEAESTREDIFKEIDILVGMNNINVVYLKEYFQASRISPPAPQPTACTHTGSLPAPQHPRSHRRDVHGRQTATIRTGHSRARCWPSWRTF